MAEGRQNAQEQEQSSFVGHSRRTAGGEESEKPYVKVGGQNTLLQKIIRAEQKGNFKCHKSACGYDSGRNKPSGLP